MEFAKWFRTEEITFKHAKGMRDVIGQEMHPFHELFLFLDGDAEFISDEGSERLRPMTVVVIPRGRFHQFVVRGAEAAYHRCVLNFDRVSELDELIARRLTRVFLTQNEEASQLFLRMQPLADTPSTVLENRILLKALLAQLLLSLQEDGAHAPSAAAFHPLTVQTIACIEKQPERRLSVAALAAALHVSSSYLSHTFKRDVRISLSHYMLEKRLILAHQKISSAVSPVQAALECGFEDYSNFYRQYKRMFGTSPSAARFDV